VGGRALDEIGRTVSQKGIVWLEAVITTPIMLSFILGMAEIGNFYVQRSTVVNAAHSIAMAIQQNPNMTAEEMYQFRKGLGGGIIPLKEVGIKDRLPYEGKTPCSVKDCELLGLETSFISSSSPVKASDILTLSASTQNNDWSNPNIEKLKLVKDENWPNSASQWKVDPNQSREDDANPYYVGVRVAWANNPLFKSLR